MRRIVEIGDEEAARRANALAAEDQGRGGGCPYCSGTGVDPGEPTFDVEHPLPGTPEEVLEFTSRRYKRLMRAGARRALHLVTAQQSGLRSAGARQFDAAELGFTRVALALIERYVGELVAERDRKR